MVPVRALNEAHPIPDGEFIVLFLHDHQDATVIHFDFDFKIGPES